MIVTKEIFEDIISDIVMDDNKPINYKFGYWPIIAQELQSEGRSKTLGSARYPLIFLNADFDETLIDYRKIRINPTFYIITQTKSNYNIDDRILNIYKPILYEIYRKFMIEIRNSHKFWVFNAEIPHTRKDLFYLQNLSASQNQINDIVDAIELRFTSLDLIKSVYDYYDSIL